MLQQKVSFPEFDTPKSVVMEAKPWRFILVGGVNAGKTTLLKALEFKSPAAVRKTQMIDYGGWGIDTPGEFAEIGGLRRVLISTAFDARLLIVVQDATREDSVFPPNYFLMFPQHTIGVVTKIDDQEAAVERARAFLAAAGVIGEIFNVSALTGEGIPELRAFLLGAEYQS
jgi:ethanolamine utilization protein EutP